VAPACVRAQDAGVHRILSAVLFVLTACWSSSPAPPARPAPAPVAAEPKPEPPAPTAPCVEKSGNSVSALKVFECANEAFVLRDWPSVDKLAEYITSRFPYSQYAHKVEVLRADALAERRDYAGAVAAYDAWLKHHATDPDREQVERKRNLARANAP
jgi:hypothetical protein